MARRVMAMRYAQAAFDIAREEDRLDKWQRDLEMVARLAEDGEVLAFFESPKVHFDDKTKLLARQLTDIDPLVLNLVYLLIDKGRMGMIGEIAGEYRHLLDGHRGIEQAEVITAAPISDAIIEKLKRRLGEVVGKEIVLRTRVDPELISGMVARVGDKLIDGSTRSKMAVLRRELRQGEA